MSEPTISRRQAVTTIAGAVLSASLPRVFAAVATATDGPPVARVDPVTEQFFGETIVDPYRWMENSRDADWESFMRGQNTYARAVLDAIPGRRRLYNRIPAHAFRAAGEACRKKSLEIHPGLTLWNVAIGMPRPRVPPARLQQLARRANDRVPRGPVSPFGSAPARCAASAPGVAAGCL